MAEDYPRTLMDLEQRFSTDAACAQYLAGLRWPDGFRCPGCAGTQAWRTARGLWICRACARHTSVTAGTIFADSNLSLRLWLRPFASPPARWPETTAATGDCCRRRSCPRSPKCGGRSPGKPTAHARCATLALRRIRDSENHRASASPLDIAHRLHRSKNAAPSPSACADNLRP